MTCNICSNDKVIDKVKEEASRARMKGNQAPGKSVIIMLINYHTHWVQMAYT